MKFYTKVIIDQVYSNITQTVVSGYSLQLYIATNDVNYITFLTTIHISNNNKQLIRNCILLRGRCILKRNIITPKIIEPMYTGIIINIPFLKKEHIEPILGENKSGLNEIFKNHILNYMLNDYTNKEPFTNATELLDF